MAGRLKGLGGPEAASVANMANRIMKTRLAAMPGATARGKAVKAKPDPTAENPADEK